MKTGRRPKNGPEGKFYDLATTHGWSVMKRGWPDFFCVHPEKGIMAVEVKPYRSSNLKETQALVMRHLAAYGIPAFQWSPSGGFVEIRTGWGVGSPLGEFDGLPGERGDDEDH